MATASGDNDQHELLPGHELEDQQGSAAPDAGPPIIVYPIAAGLFSPHAGRPR
jgi:hypothetical protein